MSGLCIISSRSQKVHTAHASARTAISWELGQMCLTAMRIEWRNADPIRVRYEAGQAK